MNHPSFYTLILLAPASDPPVSPEAVCNLKLAYTLAEAGHRVHLICKSRNKSYGRYPNGDHALRHERLLVHSVEPAKSIIAKAKAAITCFRWSKTVSRSRTSWAYPAMLKAKEICKQEKVTALISRQAFLGGLLVARGTGLPWIANFNDPFPGSRYPPPYGQGPHSRLDASDAKTLRGVVKYARCLTFPSKELENYVCSYLVGWNGQTAVIPHVALPSLAQKQTKSDQHRALRIIHTGSVKSPRDPIPFLQGLSKAFESGVPRTGIEIQFLEHSPEELRELVAAHKLSDVVEVKDPVEYQTSLNLMSDFDLALLIEAPMEVGIYLPTKFVDYAQSNLPILALSPVDGCISNILKKSPSGVAVDGQSPQQICEALVRIYTEWQNHGLEEMRSHSQELLSSLGPATVIQRYDAIFEAL